MKHCHLKVGVFIAIINMFQRVPTADSCDSAIQIMLWTKKVMYQAMSKINFSWKELNNILHYF